MIFQRHLELEGRHAFLSPSKYHWIRYDDEKLDAVFRTQMAAQRGSVLHDFASQAIRLGEKLPRSPRTLNLYVNDAIGFRMIPEQPLCYSDNAFGTCDAIAFRRNLLRIHDLKTGVIKTSVNQLEVYAALFCLEYQVKPGTIGMELRIYQSDEVQIFEPDVNDIVHIMDTIIRFDRRIELLKAEAQA